jgi:hypothetical protein
MIASRSHAASRSISQVRGAVAGATVAGTTVASIVVALGALSIPFIGGCTSIPAQARALIELCPKLIDAIEGLPRNTLPSGYTDCGEIIWKDRGIEISFCLYCSPVDPERVFVQKDCRGPYYPMQRARPRDKPVFSPFSTVSDSSPPFVSQFGCEELATTAAVGRLDEDTWIIDTTIIVPNDRMLPSSREYLGLAVEIDGRAAWPDGTTAIDAGAALRVQGRISEVAHYAATLGLRCVEFRAAGDAWAVDVHPDLPAYAVFKNGKLINHGFIFAPARP